MLYQYEHSELLILERVVTFHINFECIHPFEVGNGRTGRVLVNHQLLMNGEIPVVIPEERRIEYFNYLQSYDVQGFIERLKDLQNKELLKMKEYGVEKDNENLDV